MFATQGENTLPSSCTLTGLRLRVDGWVASPEDAGDIELLLFVGDMTAPRARIRVADAILQSGERPLNLRRRAGEGVLLVLRDPARRWPRAASLAVEILCA